MFLLFSSCLNGLFEVSASSVLLTLHLIQNMEPSNKMSLEHVDNAIVFIKIHFSNINMSLQIMSNASLL